MPQRTVGRASGHRHSENTNVIIFAFFDCGKHQNRKQFGEERLLQSFPFIMRGCQDRDSKQN